MTWRSGLQILVAALVVGLVAFAALAARQDHQAREARIRASLALLDAIARTVGADARAPVPCLPTGP